MTSGTIGSTSLFDAYYTGTSQYRTWSGSDGRYDTSGVRVRQKWNDYSMTAGARNRPTGVWVWQVRRWVTFPPPGFWIYDTYTQDVGAAPSGGFASVITSNDILALQSRLLEKVKSHDFDLGVNIGQLNQTVSLFASNLSKLGKAALALKRGDFALAARQLGASPRGTRLKATDISGRWLELMYGWLPLLSDSYEAAKAFEAISSGPRKSTVRTSITKKYFWNGAQAVGTSANFHCKQTRYLQYEMYEEMSALRQLGLYDPLSIAWELTPWSFVVDWVVPFGTYLDNLNQIPYLSGRFLTTDVTRIEGPYEQSLGPATLDPGSNPKDGNWHFSRMLGEPKDSGKYTKMLRQFSTALSVPPPEFRFSGALSARRLANAVSLAHQRFS